VVSGFLFAGEGSVVFFAVSRRKLCPSAEFDAVTPCALTPIALSAISEKARSYITKGDALLFGLIIVNIIHHPFVEKLVPKRGWPHRGTRIA
jgi:hypothetical protein